MSITPPMLISRYKEVKTDRSMTFRTRPRGKSNVGERGSKVAEDLGSMLIYGLPVDG